MCASRRRAPHAGDRAGSWVHCLGEDERGVRRPAGEGALADSERDRARLARRVAAGEDAPDGRLLAVVDAEEPPERVLVEGAAEVLAERAVRAGPGRGEASKDGR